MLAIFGALYVPLATMASYGITKQITDITSTIAIAWFFTYYPKLTGEQIKRGLSEVKRIYIKARIIVIATFAAIAFFVFFAGDAVLAFIGSSTFLLPSGLLVLLFAASMLESLTHLSTSVLLSRNEVPHYIAQTITAILSLLLIIITLKYTNAGIFGLIAVPLVVQLFYQHWKWTLKLFRELQIKPIDYLNGLKSIYKSLNIFSHNNN